MHSLERSGQIGGRRYTQLFWKASINGEKYAWNVVLKVYFRADQQSMWVLNYAWNRNTYFPSEGREPRLVLLEVAVVLHVIRLQIVSYIWIYTYYSNWKTLSYLINISPSCPQRSSPEVHVFCKHFSRFPWRRQPRDQPGRRQPRWWPSWPWSESRGPRLSPSHLLPSLPWTQWRVEPSHHTRC